MPIARDWGARNCMESRTHDPAERVLRGSLDQLRLGRRRVEPNERPVEAIHAGQRESGRAVVFALWTLLGLVLSDTFLRLHVISSLAVIVALQLLNLQQPR
jgi:hypothetical protein